MAFFCRINQSKLKSCLDQFKRHYFQISYAASLDSCRATKHVSGNVERIIPRRPADFADKFRFYAAPVQFQGQAKKEEKDTNGPRLNDKIKADVVRLVSDDGHIIISLREALERARELKLDLVEVQQKANPPVCKIMDFHREKYKKKIRVKDRVKSKAEVSLKTGDLKEVRFTGKTEEKDLRMKADMVKRLMERGYRVKCTAKGHEDQDLYGLITRLSALIEDVALVESGLRVEKGQAFVIVRHVKFGPLKKGSGSKALKVTANAKQQNVQNGPTPLDSAVDPEDDFESSEETTWSAADDINDFGELFDLKDDRNVIPSTTATKKMNVVSDWEVPDSGRTSSVPLSQQDSSVKANNRYQKIEPTNRFQPPNVTDRNSRGARDSLRSEPQIHDQRRHPPTNTNFSPPMRETSRYDNNSSISRNMRETRPYDNNSSVSRNTRETGRYDNNSSISRNMRETRPYDNNSSASRNTGETSRYDNNSSISRNMRETRPYDNNSSASRNTGETSRYDNNSSVSRNINRSSNETPKPSPSHPIDSGPSKTSFGIFSSPNSNAPGKQDPPTTSYKGNRGPPYTRSTNPNAPGAAENTKFPITNSEDNLNKGQKSWGIFSK